MQDVRSYLLHLHIHACHFGLERRPKLGAEKQKAMPICSLVANHHQAIASCVKHLLLCMRFIVGINDVDARLAPARVGRLEQLFNALVSCSQDVCAIVQRLSLMICQMD